MNRQSSRARVALIFALPVLFFVLQTHAIAQSQKDEQPSPNYTRPTVLTRPVATPSTAPLSTPQPPAADVAPAPQPVIITQGLLVETLDGKTVGEQDADETYNPASAIKLGTALAALKNFGIDYRFSTAVWTTGTLDPVTGTITGDLIISGRDPSFHYEHAVMIARDLNKQGIRVVTGDLIVAPGFTMNFDWSAQRSGDRFYDTLDATRRSAAASRAWFEERSLARDTASLQSTPSVSVMGAVYVEPVPAGARTRLIHRSSKMVDVLKVLLCYSNNFMAERIGDTLGGAAGVRRFLIHELGLHPEDIKMASTSGLGVNRVTPRAMMKIFRGLREELKSNGLSASDILPVAGIDPGTLEKRYTDFQSRGSVVAKTGTLIRTDGGVSALVGQMRARNGETLLFVIFNQRGNVWRFRASQDALIAQIQNSRGGPAPFSYNPLALSIRLVTKEPSEFPLGKDEYEPGEN